MSKDIFNGTCMTLMFWNKENILDYIRLEKTLGIKVLKVFKSHGIMVLKVLLMLQMKQKEKCQRQEKVENSQMNGREKYQRQENNTGKKESQNKYQRTTPYDNTLERI